MTHPDTATDRLSITTEPDDADPATTVHVVIDRDAEFGSAFAFATHDEALAGLRRIEQGEHPLTCH
ncbi:hypothetical protein Acy02nite_68750 [Actinoplanes cyaneus]|uniref:Uncharacterized protein n=1 Tax=Actinoplanes cyaneus TaxID=52696 RepID=A0A919INP6_9ACTN|nr:hypothetical protein [Actinoplanes cyaneus]MCW2139076.1 hypothetical protein [Actinoplanes cyaneus]GID68994.1 hypothetical protein Acy02nite_68750 [Actinoplanes cyaneus]